MKYFNKTRTVEEKTNQREIVALLQKNNDLLERLINKISKI